MTAPNRNELWARTWIEELARAGVREVVVAPGSRSTPLVLAAASHPELRLRVQIDERSAGFLALGIGKASARPAAVVTTSGTAVANLLPAVVEAAWSEAPLLLLTADRPPWLRGADANQAIDQTHLFGRYVRMFEESAPGVVSERTLRHLRGLASRAVAAAVGDPAGPVHLNLPFAKPLEPAPVPGDLPPDLEEGASPGAGGRAQGRPFVRVRRARAAPDPEALASLAERLRGAERPLLVVGPVPRPDEVGPLASRVAAEAGVPLLADPLSGARYAAGGAGALGGYDLFLRSDRFREAARPDLIVRLGSSPTSAVLNGFLEGLADVDQVVVDGGARWKDHLAVAGEYLPADPAAALAGLTAGGAGGAGPGTAAAGGAREDWLELWRAAEAAVRDGLEGEWAEGEFFEGAAVARVARGCPPGGILFVSNSMPVRDLDMYVPGLERPLRVFGNRGASGIDGIVSTACGVSVGAEGPVVAVVGDLALVHDMNGLLATRDADVRVVFVVIQNDGGGIFHRLPIRRHEPEFTRYFATPHGLEVERIAALHGRPFLRLEVGTAERPGDGPAALDRALEEALRWPSGGIVEVRTERDHGVARQEEVAARVRDAVDEAVGNRDRERGGKAR